MIQLPSIKKEIEIKVSTDGMIAYLTLNPLDSTILDAGKIMNELWAHQVNFGLKGRAIQQAIETRCFGKSFVVAEGKPPIDGQDTIIEYKFGEKKAVTLTENLDGRVDFRESAKIETVRKGDILAIKIPPTQGTDGRTVSGKIVKAKNGQNKEIPIGANTQLSSDGLALMAAENGYISWERGKINVVTTYEINSNVDMTTGNIYFVGPVKIKGAVREGFVVDAEGDIDVGDGIDNATLRSEGNISIVNGIIGKRCSVYAKGDIKCKFIENAKVITNGNLIVHDAILHSHIEADGNVFVLTGKKGAIIGGRISAGGEVNVKNIGSIAEIPTIIEVGIKPVIRQELANLVDCLAADRKDLRDVRLKYRSLVFQNRMELAEQSLASQKEILSHIRKTNDEIIQIKRYIAANRGGKISVLEKVWPGVTLIIRATSLKLKAEDKHTSFVEKGTSIQKEEYQAPKTKLELTKKSLQYWERKMHGQ